MTFRTRAHGRPRRVGMNTLEAAYAAYLESLRTHGSILWYSYEALKLRLADNTFYTPDFFVMTSTGSLEVHEVKGFWEDDARVKIKVAAEKFPFRFVAVKRQSKADGGGWSVENFD